MIEAEDSDDADITVDDKYKRKCKRLEYMTSAFKINTTPGSDEGLNWLDAMRAVAVKGNEEVFLSKFALLVDYKWS